MAFTVWLSLLMAVVCVEDIRRYTIANWLNLIVIVSFVPYAFFAAELPVMLHLAGFGALFVLGFILFSLKLLGGGDAKLLAALGLWCGWSNAAIYLVIYMGLLGGVLAILLLILRKFLPYLQAKSGRVWRLPRMCIDEQPIPYGLAIAGAFLILLWGGKLPL